MENGYGLSLTTEKCTAAVSTLGEKKGPPEQLVRGQRITLDSALSCRIRRWSIRPPVNPCAVVQRRERANRGNYSDVHRRRRSLCCYCYWLLAISSRNQLSQFRRAVLIRVACFSITSVPPPIAACERLGPPLVSSTERCSPPRALAHAWLPAGLSALICIAGHHEKPMSDRYFSFICVR